jgi:stress response protein SCP2
VPVRGTPLVRGQKWSVADKNGNIPSSLKICVGWDISDSRVQLDASAFMLKENGKVPGEEWFIFYSQTESPDRSVSYRSNDQNPNAPDDAEMYIDLGKVSRDIQKIAICVTIYEAAANRLHFGMVSNVYTRILDGRGNDLADFVFSDCSPQVTAMVVGELYRYKDTWKFSATGSGVRRELAEFCAMYGVDII